MAAGGDLGLGGARRRQRLVGEHPDIGVQGAVEPLDAVEIGPDQLDRRQPFRGDQRRRLGDRQEAGVGRGHRRRSVPGAGANTCAGSASNG